MMYLFFSCRESVQHKGCSLVIDARESLLSLEVLECIGEAVMTLQVRIYQGLSPILCFRLSFA